MTFTSVGWAMFRIAQRQREEFRAEVDIGPAQDGAINFKAHRSIFQYQIDHAALSQEILVFAPQKNACGGQA